jgi:hypothetical protein
MRDNIIKLAELNDAIPDWLHDCLTGDNGRPLPNLANILTALRAGHVSPAVLRIEAMCKSISNGVYALDRFPDRLR